MQKVSLPQRSAYEPTPEYLAARKTVVKPGYVAVHSASGKVHGTALIHVVKSESWGAAVRKFRKFGMLATLCSLSVSTEWAMISGAVITCHHCRRSMLDAGKVA